jgi:hypothetical protein
MAKSKSLYNLRPVSPDVIIIIVIIIIITLLSLAYYYYHYYYVIKSDDERTGTSVIGLFIGVSCDSLTILTQYRYFYNILYVNIHFAQRLL